MGARYAGRVVLAVLAAVAAWAAVGCGGSGSSTTAAQRQAAIDRALAVQQARVDAQAKRNRALEDKAAALEAAQEQSERTTEHRSAPEDEGDASRGGASTGRKRSFDALASSIGGQIGIAYVDPDGQVVRLGPLQTGSAWSTMKVPVAVALSRRSGGATAAMRRAITASDNASAEQMWSSLGSPAQAGQQVQSVLADAGDAGTRVQTRVTRPGFTSFGQTDWSLASSARFAAALPCLNGAAPVLDLMGQVEDDQQWGIGRAAPGSRFKGGWGPGSSGGYLVRQLGLMRLPSGGEVPLAIAALPSDGSFATGTAQLDEVAAWAAKRLQDAGSSC